jgi:ribosome-associated heat shock protein Hsp15
MLVTGETWTATNSTSSATGNRRRPELKEANLGIPPDSDARHRIDKWLWHVRLFKSRSLASEAVGGGKVKLDGERVKPAHEVRAGQQVSITLPDRTIEVEILRLPTRRGPAAEAQACYAETAQSAERTARSREQHRLAAMLRPQPDHRPDKRERRQLEQLRRRQG